MKLKTAYILFALISISATSCRENDETMTSLEIVDINNQNTIKKIISLRIAGFYLFLQIILSI